MSETSEPLDLDAVAQSILDKLEAKTPDSPPTKNMEDWISGMLEGSLGAFTGFLGGALVSAIFALSASTPVWAVALPYVASLGGFAFGFAHGVSEW